MEVNPFPEWLAEVAADPVLVCPEDTIAVAQANLWSFSLSSEQRAIVTVNQVDDFISAIISTREQWLLERSIRPMRFYCWYDAQAGQLRFSLISAGKPLPFGRPVETVSVLRTVIHQFLGRTEADGPPAPLFGMGSSHSAA